MTDEELKADSGVNAEIGSYGFELFKEGVEYGRKHIDEDTLKQIVIAANQGETQAATLERIVEYIKEYVLK